MNALVLFRSDLRLHDNETLLQAATQADKLICAYALEEKTPFLLEALRDLQAALKDLGVPLLIQETTPQVLVETLVEEHDIDAVYTQERPHPEVLDTITAPLKTYETATLYKPEDLPIEITTQDAFLRLTQHLFPPIAFAAPKELPGVDLPVTPIPELASNQEILGGETAALELLDNLLTSGGDATKLHPYLDVGCLSPRRVFYQALDVEQTSNQDTRALRYAMRERDYRLLTADTND